MARSPSEPGPAVVPEATGRKAIADLTQRVVETQAKAGVPVPGGREVEDWVRPIVEKTVRVHEERMASGPRDEDGTDARPAPLGESPSRIDRGATGEYQPIVREPGESPLAKRHLAPQVMPIEDMRLHARLELIRRSFPEFARKIHAAADDATQVARNGGLYDDDPQMQIVRRDAVLKMVELSGQPLFMGGLGLGDYRAPEPTGATKVYMQVGGRLVPLPRTEKP